ncbi:MAG: flagellar assembly protein FliW [Actinomycetes bacterium]
MSDVQDVRAEGSDIPELRFGTPMPGLDGLTRFALVRLDDTGALFSLRCLDEPSVRLLVAAPWVCAPDYAPELDDDACADLGLTRAEDAVVLVVVHPGESVVDSTVNLLAPIVVNATTGAAAQLVLTGSDLPLKAPLVPAA